MKIPEGRKAWLYGTCVHVDKDTNAAGLLAEIADTLAAGLRDAHAAGVEELTIEITLSGHKPIDS